VTGARILIAEDSKVVRAVLRQHLEEQEYAVIEAEDGEAALAACRAEKPDVVLLDVEMPGLDGHQVLTALKADPELAEVPVVFLTGRTGTADVVEGLRLGAHDYLKKPFETSELIARVSAAVRMKSLQDQLRARNAELDAMSRTDALTGLANRRHAQERLHELSSFANRHKQSVGVVMLDIDHFKQVNDTVGHAGGDAVLREFARRIQSVLRDEDTAGRWGGEEFILLLPGTDASGALVLGQRVCECVCATPFPLDDGSTLAVTVSAGCAVDDGTNPELLVSRADDALYAAKDGGRNRAVAAGPIVAEAA
jgi:two-component system cell cycle response regulator